MGGSLVSMALLPLELVYAAGVAARNRLYDFGILSSIPTGLPVVSVGNVVVGGAGKTPVSGWIARMLAEADRAPALLTRGYGEDEVALHRRWNPDIPVVVDADRVRGTETARDRGARTVVLDDGFQHRRIHRSLDIVLHPAEERGPGPLLPRGPYREPLNSLKRAHHLVITRRTASAAEAAEAEEWLSAAFPRVPVTRIHLKAAGWSDLEGEEADPPTGSLLAVTAIARPRSFARLAERTADAPVELMSFPDHHTFSRQEEEEIRKRALGRTVVTTEKDAARLAGTAHPFGESARVLRLEVVPESGMEELEEALMAATAAAAPGPSEADPGPDPAPGSPMEPGGGLDASPGGERS
ncbi:MAG: tetraacyldisaccharide 4'-kinase [Longimicrobiales bacterium]|nr:tetraacyldisaccharide 4'-kinase [Longimicrobiales bacterium]